MLLTLRPKVVLPATLAGCFFLGCGDDVQNEQTAADAGAEQTAGKGVASGSGGGSAGKAGSGGSAAGSGGSSAAASDRPVKIQFRAVLADRDFSCQEQYPNVGSTQVTVKPADFRFYVQDLKLIDAAGKEVPVSLEKRAPWQTPDVALVDFENAKDSCHGTPETNTVITGSVPDAEYKGIVFTNGVPEALNHLEQSTQPAPLDLTDMYWAWLTGYRFFVAELQQVDVDAGAAADADAGVALPGTGLLHVGSTACRKDMGCTKQNRNEIRLSAFDPDKDVIVADIAALFSDTDLTQDMQCHSSGDLCAPMFEHVGVSWETGKSGTDQTVYRVQHAQDAQETGAK